MRLHVRYEMPDEKGETRRERNTKFGVASPSIDIPDAADHVWTWFWTVSRRRKSGPEAIAYAEIGEWQRMTATPVIPEEVELLMRMDDAFLSEVRQEQQQASERAKEMSRRG